MRNRYFMNFVGMMKADAETIAREYLSALQAPDGDHEFDSAATLARYADVVRAWGAFAHTTRFTAVLETLGADRSAKAARPICSNCGSTLIVKDAAAMWDEISGEWELLTTYDDETCEGCGANGSNVTGWVLPEAVEPAPAPLTKAVVRGDNSSAGYVLALRDGHDGLLFWNGTDGYVDLAHAAVFSEDEANNYDVPISDDQPEWVALPAPSPSAA